jgi:long-chain acyl-CoA synthetase
LLFFPLIRLPLPCLNPLAASYYSLLLLLIISAIPISLYLYNPEHRPTTATMTQDLKKIMPQARPMKTGAVTVEVSGAQKVEGETIPRRNAKAKDALVYTPEEGVNTLYDILRRGSAKFGNAKAMGSRKILDTHTETKKIKKMIDGKQQEVDKNWTYFELSPYSYISFAELEKQVLSLGAAMRKLGLNPKDRLHLYASTSSQWLSMAHGKCFYPAYTPRGPIH